MDKITIISKSYDGNECLKSLAQSGIPQINMQLTNPWGLYRESLLNWGVEMPALPFESPVGIFIMLRILKKNKDGYFTNASYKDAEIAYQAIQALRHQYEGPFNQEVEGISKLLLPGILKEKNHGIIQELLLPYLSILKDLNLWDLPALYHHFIEEAGKLSSSSKASKKRRGRAIIIEEDPLTPLEIAFIKELYPDNTIETHAKTSIFSHKPWDLPGKKEIFRAYGSYNEWREVIDRILQSGQAYDEFLLGSIQEQKIAHFMREQNHVPYTLSSGIQCTQTQDEKKIEKRKGQALLAGFLDDELPGLEKEIKESLEKNPINMENSQSGKIHLTQVNALPLIYRKNVFIMGVEAYTGSQMENPILLDGDIVALREKQNKTDMKTSLEKTRQAIDDFRWTVDLMIRQNRNVTISYSYYDTAQLKLQAKPSVISPFEERFVQGEEAGYFSADRIPLSKEEANAPIYYSGKFEGSYKISNIEKEGLGKLEKLTLSATRCESLIECPYKFSLENLLNMAVNDEDDDVTRWLDPMKMGTLCHEIFEAYHKETSIKSTLDDDYKLMNRLSGQVIDKWLKCMPPGVDPEREIKEINNLTENYAKLKNDYGKHNCISVERLFEATQLIPERLDIYGKADLIEENSGELIVIDVKTGRRVKQSDQDVKSCIQGVLYCVLLENQANPLPVKGGHYLYPRNQRVVVCDYNKPVKEKAIDLVDQGLSSIESGLDWKTDDKKVCNYCPYDSICKEKDKRPLFQSLVEEGVIK